MDKLNHGLHNEKVFYFLFNEIDFIDWIITTSFYSSIHIVDYKIFPLTENDSSGKPVKFESLDDYLPFYKFLHPNWRPNLHELRHVLVRKYLHNDAANDFAWLKTNCWTARYKDYKFQKPGIYRNTAKNCLDNVKKHCITPAASPAP
jgi:hypothetical protein